jgi:RNA polymerase sigma-70 factor (ECF subfamily)
VDGVNDQGATALIPLYLERREDLVRFFTLRLRSEAAAEDLVQDMYLRLSSAAPAEVVRNPMGYLYRLGSNLMLDRLRGERRSASRDAEWRTAHHTQLAGDDLSDEPCAEDAVAARQRLTLVVQAVAELPAQTQRVFRMHKLEGSSHAEVAAALGISRSAVEKHMIAVLKHLSLKLS